MSCIEVSAHIMSQSLVFCSNPFLSCWHDAHMAADMNLVAWAHWHAKTESSKQLYLFGDQAYGNSVAIITKFWGNIINSMQAEFNHIMSKFWIQVEWSISHITTQWLCFSMKQQQKTGLTPVGQDWLVSVMLNNAKTCLIGNQVSMRLGCMSLTLDEYFSNPRVTRSMVSPNPSIPQSRVNRQDMADNKEETLVEHVL